MSIRDLLREKAKPSEWIKDLMFGGVGAVALSIVYQFFEVLKKSPELLMKWGPNFVLWMMGIAIVGVLANRVIDSFDKGIERLSEGQARMIESTVRGAEAAKETAVAQNRIASAQEALAEKGDRQIDQIETMTGYTHQQLNVVLDELRDQRRLVLEHIKHAAEQGEGAVGGEKK